MHKIILIIEDEPAIRSMLHKILVKDGFTVSEADSVYEAKIRIADMPPDLILLDWMLPDKSGLEFANELRSDKTFSDIPIIMLTARVDENDRVRGLEAGVDDYITKPFSPRELSARIHAVLRRSSQQHIQGVLTAGSLTIDHNAYRVTCNGQEIQLGLTEYKLLSFFCTHPDKVYSRTQLLDRVWDNGANVEARTVDVHIRRLRKALENTEANNYIITIRGVGYRFTV